MTEQQISKPWWKQLWPWLLISGPAVAMVGCIITIWLAVNLYADKPLRDGVVKQGLKVEQLKDTQAHKIRRLTNEISLTHLDFMAFFFGCRHG
ncbi:MAG: hypothetical protein RJB15_1361 [Pseudomonadota bacterium]